MPADHEYWSLSPDEKPMVPELAPAYEEEPRLPEGAKRHLISLEKYRVVRRKKSEHFEFSHPYYRSVARHLVKRAASLEKDELLAAIRRGLFSPQQAPQGRQPGIFGGCIMIWRRALMLVNRWYS